MERIAIIMGKMHAGGKKNLVMEYYRNIDRSKYQFDFICDSDSNSIPKEEIESLGGRVHIVAPYQNILKHCYELHKVFHKNKYKIIHAYDNLMNLFPLLIAKESGIKIRISESISTGNKEELQYLVKFVLRPFATLGANYYLANSKESALFQFGEKLLSSGKISIFKSVIDAQGNAFDEAIRSIQRKKMGWREENIVFGFIGRFVTQKNPLFLMEIFSEIHKMEPNAIFAVVGHGPMEKKILQKANELNLGSSFCFIGKTEDIKPLYNAFDAFLLPSLYEGMPIVGIEAQCTGLPTFMSDSITEETTACEMAHYLPLSLGAKGWAENILQNTLQNLPIRRSFSREIIDAGFDSTSEATRLEKYYTASLSL